MKKLAISLALAGLVAAPSANALKLNFDFVKKSLGGLANQAKDLVGKFKGKAQTALKGALHGVSHLRSTVAALIKQAGGFGVGMLEKFNKAVKAGVARALKSGLEFGKGLNNALFSGFRHFHNKFKDFWTKAKASGKGILAKIVSTGKNVMEKVRGIFSGKIKWAKGLFAKATAGIKGLVTKAKGIAKKIRGLGEKAKDSFGGAMKGLMGKLATPPAGK